MTPYHLERIAILDTEGHRVGAKERRAVDRVRDILHTMYLFLLTSEGKFALSVIPRDSALPKLYPGKFGVTIAALALEHEDRDATATRALRDEVGLDACTPTFLGEAFHRSADGVTRFQSVYCLTTATPTISFNEQKIAHLTYLTRRELVSMHDLSPNLFAPTFHHLWNIYHARLPF